MGRCHYSESQSCESDVNFGERIRHVSRGVLLLACWCFTGSEAFPPPCWGRPSGKASWQECCSAQSCKQGQLFRMHSELRHVPLSWFHFCQFPVWSIPQSCLLAIWDLSFDLAHVPFVIYRIDKSKALKVCFVTDFVSLKLLSSEPV